MRKRIAAVCWGFGALMASACGRGVGNSPPSVAGTYALERIGSAALPVQSPGAGLRYTVSIDSGVLRLTTSGVFERTLYRRWKGSGTWEPMEKFTDRGQYRMIDRGIELTSDYFGEGCTCATGEIEGNMLGISGWSNDVYRFRRRD